MNKIITVVALLLLSTAFSVFAAEGFSSLEEQMNGKEFTEAGLNKLTPQELAALNSWLHAHSVATLATARAGSTAAAANTSVAEDKRGLKSAGKDTERTTITSPIVGNFKGWDGQTTFKLENGMIWVQADKDKFYIKETDSAVAVIEPGMFGSWRLHVEGHNSECRVKRIQ